MRTRSNFYPSNSSATIPRRSNRRRVPNIVEPEICTIEEIVPMADCTMKELLQDPWKELTQIDTFYNGLTEQDQDSLNAAAGGNLLNKKTREALKIVENKSKVCYSRSKSNVSRVNTNSRDNVSKNDDRIDKFADQTSNLLDIVNKQVIAPAKAVEKTCVTCGRAHAYYDCIATDSNQPSVCTATGSYNQVSPPNRPSHQIPPSGFASVQNNPIRYNQNQWQGNYFNQANNFNQRNNFQNNQGYRAQMNNVLNFRNQGFLNQPFSVPNNQIQPVIISSKIDSLFDEFASELTLLKSIPPGIDKTDCHPEKEIRLTKRLLYDNSSPRPPEEIVSDNSNADIESFSPSPIPNEDSDPLMEEINLYFNPDDPMPPGIEDDDDDSERDIPILEELLDNYSLSLPNTESYHFDIPSPYRPPAPMIINGKNIPLFDV
nr:reverse transcriptase domain-containing protein [Tanacetum cinerariifolium]